MHSANTLLYKLIYGFRAHNISLKYLQKSVETVNLESVDIAKEVVTDAKCKAKLDKMRVARNQRRKSETLPANCRIKP